MNNNLEWIKELIPDEDDYIHICIANILDNKDDLVNDIKAIVNRTEEWIKDQSNGLTDGEVCLSAMKDIRRILKEK